MTKQAENVVDLLLRQHDEIRKLFATVEKNSGQVRKDAFDRLRHLLAVHETAEEEIVHPYARRALGNGDKVIDARLDEEREAKRTLQELEGMDPASPEFQTMFAQFQKDVEAHAQHEERDEFPQLARKASDEELRGMVAAVKAAEAMAPTHPHPGMESVAKNVTLGPITAVIDRTRDAIRKARG